MAHRMPWQQRIPTHADSVWLGVTVQTASVGMGPEMLSVVRATPMQHKALVEQYNVGSARPHTSPVCREWTEAAVGGLSSIWGQSGQ